MRSHGIEPKVMQNVVNRRGGKPWLVLISGKKGGKPGMEILPDFEVYSENGYSNEMNRIYYGTKMQKG